MPRAVSLSLGATALAVILLFRRARPAALVVGTLAVGLIWLMGAMAAAGVRISFINFIALPITFGIGVDYAVNLLGRHRTTPESGILSAMRGVGGPVVLCSLTTTLGYLALLRSHNQAVRSLGAVAVLGEASCLLSAMLLLPAVLRWRELSSRRQKA
jgi:predicted RND superfamily exporter protein